MCFGCVTSHLYNTTELYKHYQNYISPDRHYQFYLNPNYKHTEIFDERVVTFYKTKNIAQLMSIAEQNAKQIPKVFGVVYNKELFVTMTLYDLICRYNIIDLDLIQLIVDEHPSKENLKLLDDLKSFVTPMTQ